MSIRTPLVNKNSARTRQDRARKRFLVDERGLYWHMRSDQALKQVYSKIGVGIDVDNRKKEWTEFQVG